MPPAQTSASALIESRWLRAGVAFIWLTTGLSVLHPEYREEGAKYLQPLGLPPWVMVATCIGEVLLGLRVLLGRAATWLTLVQAAAILAFTVILGVTQPKLLSDPFGVLGKNLPLLAMIGTIWLLEREGWTPRAWWLLRGGMALIWFTEGLVPSLLVQPPELLKIVETLLPIGDPRILLRIVGMAQILSAITVLLLRGRWLFALVACHAVGLVAITIVVTWYDALLWFHPFGPVTKNVSILIGTLVVLRRSRELTFEF
jgi:uncharacterized membrane protein YphA (DoxX/SURF4 family)